MRHPRPIDTTFMWMFVRADIVSPVRRYVLR